MDDMEQVYTALRNADAAGDTEAATKLANYIRSTQGSASTPVPAVANTPAPMSIMDKIAKGMRDPLDGAAQLFEHVMPQGFNDANHAVNNWLADKLDPNGAVLAKIPDATDKKSGFDTLINQQEQDYQAKRAQAGESGFDGYRTIGNVVSPMNLAVASRLPAAAATASLGIKAGVGALGGSALAALNPVTGDGDYWKNKGLQTAIGGAMGGSVPVVAAGVGRVISPRASVNPDVAMLTNEGVRPTIGQTLGGWANSMEEKAQSIPIVGDMIRSARMGARDDFNNAAINRATAPIGAEVEGSGTAAIRQAGDKISDVYDAGKALLGNFKIDGQAVNELQSLSQMAQQLPEKELSTFQTMLATLKDQLTPQGHLLADGFKTFDSKIGKDADRFSGSTDAYQRQLGDSFLEMQRILTDNAKRANPQAAEMIDAANTGWANLVLIEKAAVSAKGTEGVFTPGQLMGAVRGSDQSVRDRATARGTALMQDLATAGQNVLGNKVPDSGTAGRVALGAIAGGAGVLNPAVGAGLIGGAAAYTGPAQNVLRAAVSSRPDWAPALADAVNGGASSLIPVATQIGLGVRQGKNVVSRISQARSVDEAIAATQSDDNQPSPLSGDIMRMREHATQAAQDRAAKIAAEFTKMRNFGSR
jgi:hypothetical protein